MDSKILVTDQELMVLISCEFGGQIQRVHEVDCWWGGMDGFPARDTITAANCPFNGQINVHNISQHGPHAMC
jgi:hypothetical protein